MVSVYDILKLYVPHTINSVIDFYSGLRNDKNIIRWFNFESKYDRYDLPAYVEYANGRCNTEKWYLNGVLHRSKGPAKIKYFRDGKIWLEKWFLYGKLHRLQGPAKIRYFRDGEISLEKWYLYDKLHRLQGPAVTEWRHTNNRYDKISDEWYFEGKYESFKYEY